jgi:hypothetical protein
VEGSLEGKAVGLDGILFPASDQHNKSIAYNAIYGLHSLHRGRTEDSAERPIQARL